MPQRGELHATKVLNDPLYLFNYLNGEHDIFFQSENFQRKFMHDLPKLLWNNEKIEDLGDFVLLFPNPEKVGKSAMETGISFDEAEQYFSEMLKTPYIYQYKRKFMEALEIAHNQAFLDLDIKESRKDLAKQMGARNQQSGSFDSPGSPSSEKNVKNSPNKGEGVEPSNSNRRIY